MATGYGKHTDRALALWVKLARAYGTMSQVAVEDIRKYGLTQAQFGVLEALGHLGRLTLGDISRKMLSSCGNITVVVDNLEKDGLVVRKACPSDRRVTYAELTPKGRRVFTTSFARHARRIADAASVLSPEEQKELSKLLRKLGLSMAQRKMEG